MKDSEFLGKTSHMLSFPTHRGKRERKKGKKGEREGGKELNLAV